MDEMTGLRNHRTLAVLLACLSGPATAQGDWPTYGDLLDRGQKVPDDELSMLLGQRSGIISFSLGAANFGMLFKCEGNDSPVFQFDSALANLVYERCQIEDSTICFGSPDDREECYEVRRFSASGPLFLGFSPVGSEPLAEQELEEYLSQPAEILGLVPVDPLSLENPTGEIDLGPVAFSIPQAADFTFREAAAFPLGIAVGEASYGGFRVNLEIVGWPDTISLPFRDRTTSPDDRDLARSQIEAWEASYRVRDLGGYLGATYVLESYEATPLDLLGGPCIRIREEIVVEQGEDGFTIQPAATAYFRQICVAPSGGVLFLATTALNDPEDEETVAAFESLSTTILDSLRLGFASGG